MMKLKYAITLLLATQVTMGITEKCIAQTKPDIKTESTLGETCSKHRVEMKFDKSAFMGVNLGNDNNGAVVIGVEGDKPAFNAGIQPNDIITKFNNQDVKSADDLKKLLSQAKPNDKVKLIILRDGNKIEKEVILGERKKMMSIEGHKLGFPNSILEMLGNNEDFNIDLKELGFPNFENHIKKNCFGDIESFNDKPALGVQLQELKPSLAKYFGTTENGGALVSDVIKNSAAEKAGMEVGDVITSIDGNKISNSEDIRKFLSTKKEGDKVLIGFLREKNTKTIEATLEKSKGFMPDFPFREGGKEMKIFKFKQKNSDDSQNNNSVKNQDDSELDLNMMLDGVFNNADSSAVLGFSEGVPSLPNKFFTDSTTLDLKNLLPELDRIKKEFKGMKNIDIDAFIPKDEMQKLDKVLDNTEVKIYQGKDKNKQAVAITIKSKRDKKSKENNSSTKEDLKSNDKKDQPTPGANSILD